MTNRMFAMIIFCGALAAAAPAAAQPDGLTIAPLRFAGAPHPRVDAAFDADDRADELYDEGREAIEEGRYDRAIERFTRLIALKTNRTDAALYWKAYSQAKLGQRADALNTLADVTKQFGDRRRLRVRRGREG